MRQRLGIPRFGAHRRFVGALAIDAVGTGVFGPVAVLYFLAVSSEPLERVGLALSISAAICVPATVLVGHVVDRVGPRRILLIGNLVQAVAYVLALWASSFAAILAVTTVAGIGQACFWGSYSPTVATISGRGERELWFGFLGAPRNVGFSLGGLGSGIAVQVGTQAAYHAIVLVNAASYLLAFVLLATERNSSNEHRAREFTPAVVADEKWHVAFTDSDYRLLVVANLFYAVASLALSYAMPVYAVHVLQLPGWVSGGTYAINTVLVGFAQGPIVAGMRGHIRRNILVVGDLAFALGFVGMALAGVVPPQVAVVAVLVASGVYTIGEILNGPVLTAIAIDSVPEHLRGRYMGLFQLTWNVAGVVCPAGFAWLLATSTGGVWGLLTLVAAMAALVSVRMPRRLPLAGEVVVGEG